MKNNNMSLSTSFGNDTVKIKMLIERFKLIFILSVIYAILFILFVFIILWGAVYFGQEQDYWNNVGKKENISGGLNYYGYLSMWIVGLILLIILFSTIPVITTKMAFNSFNDLAFIQKKCNEKYTRGRTVNSFLTQNTKKGLIMYTFNLIWSWIIAFNIYNGLEVTYKSLNKNK